jgi:ribonuclease III
LIASVCRLMRRLRRDELQGLEKELGHTFARPELLHHALSHRSHSNNTGGVGDSNERLEFLGDAVLDLVVTEELFRSHPDRQEGYLAKVKSLVVSAKVLAECARAIDLGSHMKLSKSEDRAGGRDRESILADAFEAVIGATYLDGGIGPCKRLLQRVLVTRFSEFLEDLRLLNYKSALLEHAQGRGWGAPRYDVLHQDGPEHGKRYTIAVRVRDEVWGEGDGASKKEAEQAAARDALERRSIPIDESAI